MSWAVKLFKEPLYKILVSLSPSEFLRMRCLDMMFNCVINMNDDLWLQRFRIDFPESAPPTRNIQPTIVTMYLLLDNFENIWKLPIPPLVKKEKRQFKKTIIMFQQPPRRTSSNTSSIYSSLSSSSSGSFSPRQIPQIIITPPDTPRLSPRLSPSSSSRVQFR